MSRLWLAIAEGAAIAAMLVAVFALTGESEQTRTERQVSDAFCGPDKGPRVVCRERSGDRWSCVAGSGRKVTVNVKDGKVLDTVGCAL